MPQRLWLRCLLAAACLCVIAAAAPGDAQAQSSCTEACAVFNGEDGEPIGHGCVDVGDPTGETNCFATSSSCSSSSCDPEITLLFDAAGTPAAVALTCQDRVLVAYATDQEPSFSFDGDWVASGLEAFRLK